MAGLVVLIVVLLVTLLKARKTDYQGLALHMAKKEREHFEVLKPCPLCASLLHKGQHLKTRVIEVTASSRQAGKQVVDRLAEVYGCPHCWPSNPGHPRICPACKKTLGPQDLVQARYFERQEGRNHLRILGCPACRHT